MVSAVCAKVIDDLEYGQNGPVVSRPYPAYRTGFVSRGLIVQQALTQCWWAPMDLAVLMLVLRSGSVWVAVEGGSENHEPCLGLGRILLW